MDLKEKKPKEQGHWGKGRPAPQEDKELAIRMVANGSGFRQTGRILGYCHETIRRWVLKSAEELPSPYPEEKPVNAVEVDEMHLFNGFGALLSRFCIKIIDKNLLKCAKPPIGDLEFTYNIHQYDERVRTGDSRDIIVK